MIDSPIEFIDIEQNDGSDTNPLDNEHEIQHCDVLCVILIGFALLTIVFILILTIFIRDNNQRCALVSHLHDCRREHLHH
jgi:hypothetical protein